MTFSTVINCMDGRIQLPVIQYLQKEFGIEYVDSITEPGPIGILTEPNHPLTNSILRRLDISIDIHKSTNLAIVAHHDCAGNPQSKAVQLEQLTKAIEFIQAQYAELKIIGLWVDENRQVHKVIG